MAGQLAGLGLGTPWNTLQLGGQLQLSSTGLRLQSTAGQLRLAGDLQLQLRSATSRLSPLPALGSYQLLLQGSGRGDDATQLRLSSLEGPLRLNGEGREWTGARLRFPRHRPGRRRPGRRAGQPAQHHRPAPGCAVRHFDRMTP